MSNIFIIVGPSGVGKTTILKKLLTKHPKLFHPLTTTTREKRPGESHGVDMFFVTKTEWHSGQSQGHYCATGYILGHHYATRKIDVDTALAQGKRVVLLLDVSGTDEMLSYYPGSVVIALMPTSPSKLEAHLLKRWPNKGPLYDERVKNINREIADISTLPISYTITSDDLDQIYTTVEALIFPELREIRKVS